jgi:hypothetical protein
LQFLSSLVVLWSSGAYPGGSKRGRAASKQLPRGHGKARALERWPESSGRGLDSKLAGLWPCHLLDFLVSLARLLRQPCHEPERLQSKLARLWPCHLLAFLVSLAKLLRQPCHEPGSSVASWRGSGLASCSLSCSRWRGCSGSLASSRGGSRASWRGSGLATCSLSWLRWRGCSGSLATSRGGSRAKLARLWPCHLLAFPGHPSGDRVVRFLGTP